MRKDFILFFVCLIIAGSFVSNVSAQIGEGSETFSRNLSVSYHGADVSRLQQFLITNGYLAVDEPTGYFGLMTYTAVVAWQETVGLPQTGYFGPMSRATIAETSDSISTPSISISNTVPDVTPTPVSSVEPITTNQFSAAPTFSDSTLPVAPPTEVLTVDRDLQVGDKGTDVVSLQSFLITKNFLPIANPTGFFGPLTIVALQRWQATAGVPTTGYFGPLTRASLRKSRVIDDESFSQDTSNSPPSVPVQDQTQIDTPPVPPVYIPLPSGGGGGGGSTPPPTQPLFVPVPTPAPVVPPVVATTTHATTTPPVILPPVDIVSPTVSITSPTASSTVTGEIIITIKATDNVKVSKVELYIDTVLKGVATTSPYLFSLDTLALTTQTHVINAKAYDMKGNNATTKDVVITVVRPVPTTPQNLTVTGVTTSSISLTWAPSSELGGSIKGYKLYREGSQIATTTLTSFTHSGLASSTIYRYAVSSYDESGVTSTISDTVATTTRAIASPRPTNSFGMSVGESMLGLSTTTLNQQLDNMVLLGTDWIRFDIAWATVQPQANKPPDWSRVDRLVTAINAHHIKTLAILDYIPRWMATSTCPTSTPHCAPSNFALFAVFAKEAVQRYAPKGISHWEIWNEPNNAGFWGPKSDCVAYTNLLKVVYPAIKSADPKATVITAGLAPEPTDGRNMSRLDFLTCVYKNGGKNYFDAVGDHPYTFPSSPATPVPHAWAQMITTNPSMRSIMIANGDAKKKIWMTEFGAPTNGPDSHWYVSETKQAQMVTDTISIYKTYDWAGPLFFYTLRDPGTATTTNENFFGLTRADNSLKPAFTTLKSIISGGL